MAQHAESRHDDAHLGNLALGPGTHAAGTREILECWLEKRPVCDEYLIVHAGKLAVTGAHSYSAGNATGGSEEAAKFKTAR